MDSLGKYLSLAISLIILFQRGCVAVIALDACSVYPGVGGSSGDPSRIEGRAAEPDSRPWIVLAWISCEGQDILARNGFPGTLRTCQGTLIREEWILTTASCFPCGEEASVIVDVGLHNSDIRTEVALQRPVERIGADAIFLNPGHDFLDYSYDSDLALVRLSRPVKNASRVVSLIDCNGERADASAGKFGVSSGWGATRSQSSLDPKPLQDAFVCLWPSRVCNQVMGTNTSGIICAGASEYPENTGDVNAGDSSRMRSVQFDENAETCYADRGSPLMLSQAVVREAGDNGDSVSVECEWRVYGVLLFGMSCAHLERMPGVYADVCAARTWIENTIEKEEGVLSLMELA